MSPGVAPFQGGLPTARPSSLLPPHLREWKLFRFWLREPVSSQGNIVSPRRGGIGPGISPPWRNPAFGAAQRGDTPRACMCKPEGTRPETHTDVNRNRNREARKTPRGPSGAGSGSSSQLCSPCVKAQTTLSLKNPFCRLYGVKTDLLKIQGEQNSKESA